MVLIAERLVDVILYKSKAVLFVPVPVTVTVSPKIKIFPALITKLFTGMVKNL